jgi:hypothetical protein
MNRKGNLQKGIERVQIYLFLNYTSSFFPFFFFSFWHLQVKNKQKNSQEGIYQVAVKNNVTVDNHQVFQAYHQSIQGNIPGQPSRASQPIAAHSPMHELRCQAPR